MAHFEKIVKDIRGKTRSNGKYKVYPLSVKTDIAIHHSLTKVGDSYSFANYHAGTHKWPGVAYHFVILKDGTIEYNHPLGALTYHVGNSNMQAVGICLVGDFRTEEPTDQQKKSLYDLHRALVKDLPNYKRTRGHDEFPGYDWKACPCFKYKRVLSGDDLAKGYLSRGDNSTDVSELQKDLRTLGYDLKVDGNYGPNTEKAVKGFQKAHNLSVDGLYGPNTQKALKDALKRYSSVANKESEEDTNMADTGFKDVEKDAYYADAVKRLKEQGIIVGDGNDNFLPDENIKRKDFAVALDRALNK